MERDFNLLFGILAVQLRKVTPAHLVEAAAAWADDPSRTLADHLAALGHLSERDRSFVEDVARRAVADHQENATEALVSFGGDQQVYSAFQGTILPTTGGGFDTRPASPEMLELLGDAAAPGVREAPGRYTHLGEFGRGGMGRVLMVHDEHLSRDIAMKELLPEFAGGGSTGGITPIRRAMPLVSRFLQEAKITGQLEHPSIVPVYELGYRADGSIYYTMKLVRGRTLAAAIRDAGGLSGRIELLPHFVDLCNAIAYAHSRGVIHRDIKPANVMVGDFGETVVLDWGIAKAKAKRDAHASELEETMRALSLGDEGEMQRTQYGQALGTPVYMPPEQAEGRLDDIDERSDVYALGAVLYELLAGAPPYTGKSVAAILHEVVTGKPKPLSETAPEAPPELAAICERAMRRDPAGRYASAKELAEDIRRFQSGALVQAHRYSARDMVRRFVKQHRAALLSAAAALIAVVALAVYAFVSITQERNAAIGAKLDADTARVASEQARTQAEEQRNQAQAARENEASAREAAEESLEAARRASYRGGILLAQVYMNNQQFDRAVDTLWSLDESQRNWEWAYYLGQSSFAQSRYEEHPFFAISVDYLEESGKVFSTGADGLARVWDPHTLETSRVFGDEGVALAGAALDPAQQRVALYSWDGEVSIWNIADGSRVAAFQADAEPITLAAFNADGTKLATASLGGRAAAWDAETGERLYGFEAVETSFHTLGWLGENQTLLTAADAEGNLWTSQPDTEQGISTGNFAPPGDVVPGILDFLTTVYSKDGKMAFGTFLDASEKGGLLVGTVDVRTLSFAGDTAPITVATFTPDSNQLVTGHSDGTIRLWSWTMTSVSLDSTLLGHTQEVIDIEFDGDGGLMFSVAEESAVQLWRRGAHGRQRRQQLVDLQSIGFPSARLSSDGQRIIERQIDHIEGIQVSTYSFVDVASAKVFGRIIEHDSFLHIRPDRKLESVFADSGSVMAAWSGLDGKNILTLSDYEEIAVSEFGEFVYVKRRGSDCFEQWSVASKSREADCLEAGPERELEAGNAMVNYNEGVTLPNGVSVPGHQGGTTFALLTDDGSRLFTSGIDMLVRVWDAADGSELATLPASSSPIISGAFVQADNELLLLDEAGGLVRLQTPPWRVEDYPGNASIDARDRYADYIPVVDKAEPIKRVRNDWEVHCYIRPAGEAALQAIAADPGAYFDANTVTAVEGAAVADKQQTVEHLSEALARALGGETDIVSWTVTKDGAPLDIRYWLHPVRVERVEKEAVPWAFAAMIDIVAGLTRTGYAALMNEPLENLYGVRGVTLSTGGNPVFVGLLDALGFPEYVLVTKIGDETFETPSELLEILERNAGKIKSGEMESVEVKAVVSNTHEIVSTIRFTKEAS